MAELIQTHWLALVLAVLLGLFVAWWLFGRNKPERERHVSPDVLDEGAAPANRNQALIDAPPAAAAMDSLAGAGIAVAAAGGEDRVETENAEHKVEAATAAAATTPQTADAPPVAPGPAPEPASVPEPADPANAEALKQIKGVGPKLRTRLAELGITTVAQVAAWSEEDVERIDAQLDPRFHGRIRRDNWVEQARLLETGDRAAYEAKFGKL